MKTLKEFWREADGVYDFFDKDGNPIDDMYYPLKTEVLEERHISGEHYEVVLNVSSHKATIIDLSRFIDNKFEVKIVGIEKTTHEWTENGEGEYVGSWDMSYVNSVSRITKEEIFGGKIRDSIMEAVNEESYIDHIEEKDICISDCGGYITFSYIEDDRWLNDCTLMVFINGITVSKEELALLLPAAENMF